MAIHPKRPQLLATATSQGISLHDLRDAAELWAQNATASNLVFSPDGRRLAAIGRRSNRGVSSPGPAVLLDPETGTDLGASGPTRPSWLPSIPREPASAGRHFGGGRAPRFARQTGRNAPAAGSGAGPGDGLLGRRRSYPHRILRRAGPDPRRRFRPHDPAGCAARWPVWSGRGPDGRLIAAADSQEVIRIVDSSDLRTIAVLPVRVSFCEARPDGLQP